MRCLLLSIFFPLRGQIVDTWGTSGGQQNSIETIAIPVSQSQGAVDTLRTLGGHLVDNWWTSGGQLMDKKIRLKQQLFRSNLSFYVIQISTPNDKSPTIGTIYKINVLNKIQFICISHSVTYTYKNKLCETLADIINREGQTRC